jgi:excisionase family DNA binding protein
MRINEVAKQLGVSADLLRRLERTGVLPPARRDRSGHRRFNESEIEQLRKILYPLLSERPSSAPDGSLVRDTRQGRHRIVETNRGLRRECAHRRIRWRPEATS